VENLFAGEEGEFGSLYRLECNLCCLFNSSVNIIKTKRTGAQTQMHKLAFFRVDSKQLL